MGEFILSHDNIKIPEESGQKIYSFNEGNYQLWCAPLGAGEGLQGFGRSLGF